MPVYRSRSRTSGFVGTGMVSPGPNALVAPHTATRKGTRDDQMKIDVGFPTCIRLTVNDL